MSEPTSTGTSLRTALTMLAFTLVFTGVMAWTYSETRPTIDAAALAEKLGLINEVLPVGAYDNALLDDFVETGPAPQLGVENSARVYRARKGGAAAGLVLEAVARDGYSGEIGLLIALRADGTVSGVRVTRHRETPGLGDYIDIRKDKRKDAPWITQFNGLGPEQVPQAQWRIRKDGGHFDFVTGATISARAVTNAVARAVAFAAANRERLYTAASGSAL